jgi:hypothetical protein
MNFDRASWRPAQNSNKTRAHRALSFCEMGGKRWEIRQVGGARQ